jgi:short-subunit dehydrogenase
MTLKEKYGSLAFIAGASEGIGAAYARHLAAAGINLILLARRKEPLEKFAAELTDLYGIETICIQEDLADTNAADRITEQIKSYEINLFIYNAGNSYIGKFEEQSWQVHREIAVTNMITPLQLVHSIAPEMLKRGKGAIILMASLAGFQGTPFIATYAATKAFDQILAEGLWYEWKTRGIDVIACCAGATSSPNFLNTNPGKQHFLAPKVQTPEEVVTECFKRLGTTPSFITGRSNKIASFFMQRILSRKKSVTTMGETTKKMYRV